VCERCRSDDLDLHSLPPQRPPPLKRYSSTFEDPFSDVLSAFDNPVQSEPADPETPSIDRDHKLLSFTAPSFDFALLDYTYRRTTISMAAQLHGMFFLAESPWASTTDMQSPPTELTCYRRNLFQIAGEVTLPQTLRYIVTEQGEQIPIVRQELVISAIESTESNPVKIISVPWKNTTNPNAPTIEDKVEREPPSIPLDPTNVQEHNTDFARFPFHWKRLQFRIATANNGRRKELQQNFVLRLKIQATLATGGRVSICEVQSGAIIVRGRSPRNFQTRKDMPLNGGGHLRKSSHSAAQTSRTPASDATKRSKESTSAPPVTRAAPPPPLPSNALFDPNDLCSWNGTAQAHLVAATATFPRTSPLENAGIYASTLPDLPHAQNPAPTALSAPINLSLVEDDPPRRPGDTVTPPPSAKKIHIPPRPPSFSLHTINSPDESADLLYEYFPLGLDDWMPPVEAVYRPHVVHHTKLPCDPRDPRAGARSARNKRYFSEDVS